MCGARVRRLAGRTRKFAKGRTARSIFYRYVLSRGYWLFAYMPISRIILRSKRDYALTHLHTGYDDVDLTYFIIYTLGCTRKEKRGREFVFIVDRECDLWRGMVRR